MITATAEDVQHRAGPSLQGRALATALRLTVRPALGAAATTARIGMDLGPRDIELWPVWSKICRVTDQAGRLLPPPRGTRTERVRLPDCNAEWVTAPGVGPTQRAILYFHGGAFVGCGLHTHRRLVARLSHEAEANVLNVDYRMLPRFPVTNAVQDALDGYRYLLDMGYAGENVVVAGDSAGGGLAVRVACAARAQGLPLPAGIIAFSPWVELDVGAALDHPNAPSDPVVPAHGLKFVAERLIRKGEPLDTTLTVDGLDLHGLPPTLIHVGGTEVMVVDAEDLHARLTEHGVATTLTHWPGQVHVFQAAADIVPEARASLHEAGRFVRRVSSC